MAQKLTELQRTMEVEVGEIKKIEAGNLSNNKFFRI
jgi:hypothetical protein